MSFAATMTAAALLIASPSTSDLDRIAANGGFLVGNAHRCGLDVERVVRAGELVRDLIGAAASDEKELEAGSARFAEFFLVSAFADTKQDKLIASCKTVAAELAKLEEHRVAMIGSAAEQAGKPERFRLEDGE